MKNATLTASGSRQEAQGLLVRPAKVNGILPPFDSAEQYAQARIAARKLGGARPYQDKNFRTILAVITAFDGRVSKVETR